MAKLLNIGCGSTFHPSWENLDLVSVSPEVKSYDIRKGLPYDDAYFEACYSSHILEHNTQQEAKKLLAECLRVLKPAGIIRVVVPDLESIVRKYIETLDQIEGGVIEAEPNYDWMMLELYDQTVRSFPGGDMGLYLTSSDLKNKNFILSRIGAEAESYWLPQEKKNERKTLGEKIKAKKISWLIDRVRISLAKKLVTLIAGKEVELAFEEGLFRNSGEIHRWMYDRFSLRRMLEKTGFVDVRICGANESIIPDFNSYGLDVIEGKVRKPDSLFMEGRKP